MLSGSRNNCAGGIPQRQDPFADLIDLDKGIGIEFFKFRVQLKKFIAADVPMEATNIHVKKTGNCQQFIQQFSKGARFLRLKSDLVLLIYM